VGLALEAQCLYDEAAAHYLRHGLAENLSRLSYWRNVLQTRSA
jgi:hypothetical protein